MFGWKSRLRLARENAVMRQTLLWYATEENWRRVGIHPRGAPRVQWRKSPAAFDRGHLALRALRVIEDPIRLLFGITTPLPTIQRELGADARAPELAISTDGLAAPAADVSAQSARTDSCT